jgi:hypothetical protein
MLLRAVGSYYADRLHAGGDPGHAFQLRHFYCVESIKVRRGTDMHLKPVSEYPAYCFREPFANFGQGDF